MMRTVNVAVVLLFMLVISDIASGVDRIESPTEARDPDFPDGRYLSSQNVAVLHAGSNRAPWPEEPGSAVDGRADVNGDGHADVIVGACFDSTDAGETGAVYAYFGGPSMDDQVDVVLQGPPAAERFGQSLSSAGDFNGDGFDDLIIGAPRRLLGWGTVPAGQAFIYFGGPDFGGGPDVTLTGDLTNDHFGRSVAGAGDVNDDGYADVIVGAPGHHNNWSGTGRAFIYFGGPAAGQGAGLMLTGEGSRDSFGQSVSGAGDVNGDGVDDLIVGAPGNDAHGLSSGRACIYFGGPNVGYVPEDRARLDPIPDVVLDGGAGQQVGATVCAAGDVNGDGYDDVLVAARNMGRTLVFLGGATMSGSPDAVLPGGTTWNARGSAALGDVNGDGRDDVAVGEPDSARVRIFLGGTSMDAQPDLFVVGRLHTGFGHAVAGTGDVDGDGTPDIVVGSAQSPQGTAHVARLVGSSHKVVSPNLGEFWFGGTTLAIEWLGDSPADVEISLDDGGVWTRLGTGLGGPGGGTLSTVAPNRTTEYARVRVVTTGQTPTPSNSDASDGAFTIYRYGPIVVAADGTGDVTSFRDALALAAPIGDSRSITTSLTVMPGFYDEEFVITPWMPQIIVNCPAGPDFTRVRSIFFEPSPEGELGADAVLQGLGVVEPVLVNGSRATMSWRNCRFEGGYKSRVWSNYPNIKSCEFNGPSELMGYVSVGFDSLRFRGATLRLRSSLDGSVGLDHCTFEGPVDTALIVSPNGNSPTHIRNSTFSGARFAVVAEPRVYASDEAVTFDRCRFEASETAISYDYDGPVPGPPLDYWGLGLSVTRSEFTGGKEAIRWNSYVTRTVYMDSVTISGPSGDAVFARLAKPSTIQNVTIRNAGGRGIVLRPEAKRVAVTVHGCRIEECKGDGIVVEDPAGWLTRLTVTSNVVARNGGAGIRLTSTAVPPEWPEPGAVAVNTSVLNAGDGLILEFADPGKLAAHHNLSAGNEGAGLRVDGLAADSIRHNDAWSNRAGDYIGDPISAENISSNPGFCDPLAGDWHVQSGSPCAPSGPYGQIGALGVGCAASRVAAAIEGGPPVNANSNMKLRLMVPGHRLLDVAHIMPATAQLGSASPESWSIGDRDRDGFDDLLLEFRARDLALVTAGGPASFVAMLDDGLRIGADVGVRSVPTPRAGGSAAAVEDRFAIDIVRSAGDGHAVLATVATRAGAAAEVELFDILGRRLERRSISAAGGTQVLELISAGAVRNGVYFVRLTQRHEQMTRKVVLLQ